jgi:hypothetical protein
MITPDDSAEPLQKLPAGMPRRYAEYKPASTESSAPLTNVGGYEDLLKYLRGRGQTLPRTPGSLVAIDDLIDGADDRESLARLARPIGMFYGDVLTHTIPEARWEVVEEEYPLVRVTSIVAVDVVRIAIRRLAVSRPTLEENYAHVLGIAGVEA